MTRLSCAGLAIVSHASDDVSSRLAQVALLVLRVRHPGKGVTGLWLWQLNETGWLQDLEEPEGCLGCAPTEAGMQVARLLQSAVFGEDSMDVSFMQCVYLGSLTQVWAPRCAPGMAPAHAPPFLLLLAITLQCHM